MTQSNEMTGGEAMARMLKAFGSGPMFGMGGFQLLAFYDAARRLKLDHHLINDARCGAFAADAYAKEQDQSLTVTTPTVQLRAAAAGRVREADALRAVEHHDPHQVVKVSVEERLVEAEA